MISPKTPTFITDELRKGEHITWLGQPDKIWVFRCFSPLMLLALVIAIGMRHHVDLQFRGVFDLFVWGIDLIKFVPVAALAAAPLLLCRRAARCYYVLTDQRVITVVDGRRRTYESYERQSLTPSMRMDILGRTIVAWTAPGFHNDSDGRAASNGVSWQALDPRAVAKMGIDFPNYRLVAGQNINRSGR